VHRDALVPDWYWPTAQLAHAPDAVAAYMPTAQLEQLDDPAFAAVPCAGKATATLF
jgi:hypothetical protein